MRISAPYPEIEYTISLPNPSLNDNRRATHELIKKRNLDHDIITYIKRNNNKQFSWQVILSLAKMWELYYFMREYFEKQMQVVDHKDKVLVGYFINGPNFIHERRADFPSNLKEALQPGERLSEELTSITLEFVGNYL